MDINRNHWFITGVVLVAMGIQFRVVDSFVLNEPTTTFIQKRLKKKSEVASMNPIPMLFKTPPASRRTIKPPKWIGWALLSVGGVLMLHSLTMKGPD